MLDPAEVVEHLIAQEVNHFVGVPDSLLKHFCAAVDDMLDERRHVIAANEGSAVGLAIGYHLATGRIPAVYMQNSGLGNSVNPITSLADKEVYSIPLLLIIGWRGEPGRKDEPQHLKQGRVTKDLLDALEIPHLVLAGDFATASDQIQGLVSDTRASGQPHALLVQSNTFAAFKSAKAGPIPLPRPSREQCIRAIIGLTGPRDIIVSTTGMASRELFELREESSEGHARDFLTVGGMGHASQIALGIAKESKRRVFCIDGDGALLMHMGSLATNGTHKLKNFHHVIINNGAHESVGGQKTVANRINLPEIAKACGYESAFRAEDTESDSIAAFVEAKGPSFLEFVAQVGHRSDLGRPSTTPVENKIELMRYIDDDDD